MSKTEAPSTDHVARESARGAALITFAKLWFMATGFLQPLVLTRLLGRDGYGLYGVVLSAVSILNNVVVSGSIQSMSRAVIQGGSPALRRGLALHAALGATLGLTLVAAAGPFGAQLLGDPQVPRLLRIAAIVVADYTVYAALVGAFNGRRRFGTQAGLDITFSTLRTGLILALSSTQLRVLGAVAGFAVASAVITAVALALSLRDLRGGAQETDPRRASFGAFAKEYGRFFAPALAYQFALNLVLQGDTLLFKGLSARAGLGADEANTLLGVYKAAQNFAFMPYQLLLAVTFVVFPVVSRATLEGDRETTVRFIDGASRFSAMALGGMLAVIAGLPRGVLHLAYRADYEVGDVALRTLALGQGSFALTVIATTILLAAGRTRAATFIMSLSLVGVVVGDALGVTLSGGGTAALNGVALGTACGQTVGLVAAAMYMRTEFGTFLRAITAARVALCAAVAGAVAGVVPLHGKVGTLAAAAVCAVVYVVMLVVTRELGAADLAIVTRLARRKAA